MHGPSPSAALARGLVDRLRRYTVRGAARVTLLFVVSLALRLAATALALVVHVMESGADLAQDRIRYVETKYTPEQYWPSGKERPAR